MVTFCLFVSKGRLRPTIKSLHVLVSGPTMSSATFLTNAYCLQSDKVDGADLHWKCEGPGASGAAIRPKRDVP